MSTRDEIESVEDNGVSLSMNPKKFILWLFIVSIVMIFVSLTSAYIVRQAEGNWKLFELPSIFLYSTIVLLMSSATMHWGYVNAKNDELQKLKIAIGSSLFLGILFLWMQMEGWKELVSNNIFFSFSNPSEAFLYVLTGLHAFHLVSGLIFIIIVLISSFKHNIHAKNLAQYEICLTYWHFLDGLWLYLYIFLMINR
ncbi:MAG TPA: cytochrome oxidase subunit III [Cytophagales bacterium]|nr:cytochrome oxidase subunit III [Cytophagales bacterium]